MLGLFAIPQADLSVPGKRDIQRAQKDAKAHKKVAAAKLVSQEVPDRGHHISRTFRVLKKYGAQQQDNGKGDHRGNPVQLSGQAARSGF